MTLRDPAQSVADSIDGDHAAALLKSVRDHELPPVLHDLVAEYQTFEGARPWFIWRWVHQLAPKNRMPVVDDDHRETVATNKTMLVLFITILDDLLENQSDYETFEKICRFVRPVGGRPPDIQGFEGPLDEAATVVGNEAATDGAVARKGVSKDVLVDDALTDEALTDIAGSDEVGADEPIADAGIAKSAAIDEPYVAFARSVWETLLERLEASPSFDRYAPLFRFDVRQIITAIEYSALVIDRPDLATATDLRHYEVHNMGMDSYLDIDLMHASADYTDELESLRAVVDPAQRMARIGNWLSTWERELRQGDISSGVVIAALERGIVNGAQLSGRDGATEREVEQAIDRIRASDIEAELLEEWNDEYRDLVSLSNQVEVVDVGPFVEGTKDVLRYHLASRGFK